MKAETFFKNSDDEPYHTTFYDALDFGFTNGHGKLFCSALSRLCSDNLYLFGSLPMVSDVYGFKLKRVRGIEFPSSPSASEIVTGSSTKSCEMWVSDNFNVTSHYADDNTICDTLVTKKLKTAVLFECKSNCKDLPHLIAENHTH